MVLLFAVFGGCVIVAIVIAATIQHIDRKIRHPNEIHMKCGVCMKTLWIPRTQLATWVIGGMRGDGRCDCGATLKSVYLAHHYTQKVISNAYSQMFRDEAATDTIKNIRQNIDLANKIRLPEVSE